MNKEFYHNCFESHNLIGSFSVVDKRQRCSHQSARRNFNIYCKSFFDVDIVVKNKSNVV